MKTKNLIFVIFTLAFIFSIVPSAAINAAEADSDIKVRVLVEPSLEFCEVGDFSDGLAAVYKDMKWAFVDKTGTVVIPFGTYENIGSFSGGLAAVYKNEKYGYIDKTGKIIIPFIYDQTTGFNEGLAWVRKGDSESFVDRTGKEIIILPRDYYFNVGGFFEGLARVNYGFNICGYIDKTGKLEIITEYDWVSNFSDGLALVSNKDGWGYIDKTGKVAISFREYGDWSVGSFNYGLAAVNINNKWGYIDKTGKPAWDFKYSWAYSFSEGLAVVSDIDGKGLGCIDTKGNVVVPFGIYDKIESFSDSVAWVQKDGKWGLLQILRVGDPIGDVLYSDIKAYINGEAIPTNVINGVTLVVVEDLARYGFDVIWNNNNRSLKVEQNKNKKFTLIPTEKDTTNKPGTFKCKYFYTDIKTYLSGEVVESYAINGVTLIDFELLAKYGSLTWNGKSREIRLVID